MRAKRLLICSLVLLVPAPGAEKKLPTAKASNDAVEITATAYLDRQEAQRRLGAELEDVIAVVEVRLSPKPGTKLAVLRDDFELRSYKNGGRSAPFAPSQIAGSGVLVVSTTGGGSVAAESPGRVWGPPMGGRPKRLGGEGASMGNSAGGGAASSVESGGRKGTNPLLDILEKKILPEEQISKPLEGLLYFFLEGKHKAKDIELVYRGPAGKLSLLFKD